MRLWTLKRALRSCYPYCPQMVHPMKSGHVFFSFSFFFLSQAWWNNKMFIFRGYYYSITLFTGKTVWTDSRVWHACVGSWRATLWCILHQNSDWCIIPPLFSFSHLSVRLCDFHALLMILVAHSFATNPGRDCIFFPRVRTRSCYLLGYNHMDISVSFKA